MPHPALLAISHGTGSRAGQAAVAALVDAVAARLPEFEVRLGHVDVQRPDVEASLAALPDRAVVIVPLLLSAGYHVHVDLAEAAATRDDVVIAPALGPDPRLAEVLADRLAQTDAAPTAPVVLAVAGSSDERANDDCREVARLLSARLGREVSVGFLAAAEPRLPAAVAAVGDDAVVATYLLAPGYFHDLTVAQAAGRPVARPLLDADPPASALVELVIDRYRAAVGGHVK
ncbi:sirohydrochlorin chelatase [Microbacterium fluvii]|uniref:Sirohydrochlorin chelatase n=1 Tax=Microbacterium fluvii TaxID=415215 RepID=A0ABW2HEA4_9MICO|nr:CbiX/SirB N-terminal domain-containing protein [Microbacterium fluvii]MCU4672816.1 cobalamin biosynthesis protein CbiX [Microbacterium fluvii]